MDRNWWIGIGDQVLVFMNCWFVIGGWELLVRNLLLGFVLGNWWFGMGG